MMHLRLAFHVSVCGILVVVCFLSACNAPAADRDAQQRAGEETRIALAVASTLTAVATGEAAHTTQDSTSSDRSASLATEVSSEGSPSASTTAAAPEQGSPAVPTSFAVESPTPTQPASAAPAATWPPSLARTAAPTTTPSAPPTACVAGAAYVADVTIPDDTVVCVGRQFDKTWRLRNSGTCNWDAGYELRYVRGDTLGASASVSVPFAQPGDVVEATVPMVAPATAGTYRGEWQVCAVGGECFGERVYVLVSVRQPTPTPTNTPVPTNTPKPISTVTFQEIRSELDRLSGESASAYKQSLLGQRVEWVGYAYGTLRDGGITVEMDSPDSIFSLPDVNLAWAPGNELAAPGKYQVCLFRGDIAGFSSFLGHLEVDLADGILTSIEDARSRARRLPTYDALARNTEDYVGNLVTFRGEVAQVSEVSDPTVILRINVTRGTYFWDDAVWVNYTGPRVLEEDIVDVLAVVVGRRTYTAVLGNSVTIPELAGLSVSVAK